MYIDKQELSVDDIARNLGSNASSAKLEACSVVSLSAKRYWQEIADVKSICMHYRLKQI